MNLLNRIALVMIVAAALPQAALAQREGDGRRHNQSGGVNLAPLPAVYTVVSIDSYAQTVKLRAQDGTITGDVYVSEGIYNLSKLNPGDKIQVNFLEPDGLSNRLAAANIWKVQ
jgi:hypothetical protein